MRSERWRQRGASLVVTMLAVVSLSLLGSNGVAAADATPVSAADKDVSAAAVSAVAFGQPSYNIPAGGTQQVLLGVAFDSPTATTAVSIAPGLYLTFLNPLAVPLAGATCSASLVGGALVGTAETAGGLGSGCLFYVDVRADGAVPPATVSSLTATVGGEAPVVADVTIPATSFADASFDPAFLYMVRTVGSTTTGTLTITLPATAAGTFSIPAPQYLAFTDASGAGSQPAMGCVVTIGPDGANISGEVATVVDGVCTISFELTVVGSELSTSADSIDATVTVGALAPITPSATIFFINPPVVAGDGSFDVPFETSISDSIASLASGGTDTGYYFSVVTDVTNGTLVLADDGSFTYTPNDGFLGSDSFTYFASDRNDEAGDEGTVTFNVAPLPTPTTVPPTATGVPPTVTPTDVPTTVTPTEPGVATPIVTVDPTVPSKGPSKVTALPNTGAGPSSSNGQLLILMSAVGIIMLAGIAIRRRPKA